MNIGKSSCRYEKLKTSPYRLGRRLDVAKHKDLSKLEERLKVGLGSKHDYRHGWGGRPCCLYFTDGATLCVRQISITVFFFRAIVFIFTSNPRRSRQNSRELKRSSWSCDLVRPWWTWRQGDWAGGRWRCPTWSRRRSPSAPAEDLCSLSNGWQDSSGWWRRPGTRRTLPRQRWKSQTRCLSSPLLEPGLRQSQPIKSKIETRVHLLHDGILHHRHLLGGGLLALHHPRPHGLQDLRSLNISLVRNIWLTDWKLLSLKEHGN